jgi:hypothetical protein
MTNCHRGGPKSLRRTRLVEADAGCARSSRSDDSLKSVFSSDCRLVSGSDSAIPIGAPDDCRAIAADRAYANNCQHHEMLAGMVDRLLALLLFMIRFITWRHHCPPFGWFDSRPTILSEHYESVIVKSLKNSPMSGGASKNRWPEKEALPMKVKPSRLVQLPPPSVRRAPEVPTHDRRVRS